MFADAANFKNIIQNCFDVVNGKQERPGHLRLMAGEF